MTPIHDILRFALRTLSPHRPLAALALAALLPILGANQPAPRDLSLPFTLTEQNNIVLRVLVNETDALDLMLHTAAREVTLTEEAVKKSTSLKFTAAATVQTWGGEANSRFSRGNRVRIGTLQRDNLTIWENRNSGPGTDGKFGLDLFPHRIVEIDFDRRRIELHHRLPRKASGYARLRIDNQNGQLFVEGRCLIEGTAHAGKFLLHSGYSGGLLLDDEFAARTGVDGKIRITEESSLKDSFGNIIKVKKGLLPAFTLGGISISDVPAGFFAGAIGAQKMSVPGGDVLKRFNLIFDLTANDLYLTPRRA